MNPRNNILDLFTTFALLESDRFRQWVRDAQLRRSMQRAITAAEPDPPSERVWSLYWHKHWQTQTPMLAQQHLAAYLQETCYWTAQQLSTRFINPQYTLSDHFQIANSELTRVLKSFDPDRNPSLKSFAAILLANVLKDTLRQRQAADFCTDWALLRKVSNKRVIEALQHAGVAAAEIEPYRFAWVCFKTIYTPNTTGVERLPKPDGAVWSAIAELYNQKRHAQLTQITPALSPAQIESYLTKLTQWIRAYLYPSIGSINQIKPGQDSGEVQDDLVAPGATSLLEELVQSEEQQARVQQRSQLQTVLTQALAQLDTASQEILRLFYQEGCSQQELAQRMQMSQPTVSRRLKKAEETLLHALLDWTDSQMNKSHNPDELKTISPVLKEWLMTHYQKPCSEPTPFTMLT